MMAPRSLPAPGGLGMPRPLLETVAAGLPAIIGPATWHVCSSVECWFCLFAGSSIDAAGLWFLCVVAKRRERFCWIIHFLFDYSLISSSHFLISRLTFGYLTLVIVVGHLIGKHHGSTHVRYAWSLHIALPGAGGRSSGRAACASGRPSTADASSDHARSVW